MNKVSRAQLDILKKLAEGQHIIGVGSGDPHMWLNHKRLGFKTFFALKDAGYIHNEKPDPYSPVDGRWLITDTGRAIVEADEEKAMKEVKQVADLDPFASQFVFIRFRFQTGKRDEVGRLGAFCTGFGDGVGYQFNTSRFTFKGIGDWTFKQYRVFVRLATAEEIESVQEKF